VKSVAAALPLSLARAGDFLVVVGEPRDTVTGSAYLRAHFKSPAGGPPQLDLPREARLQELAVAAAEGGWAAASHDVSDGGLAVALAEMVMAGGPEHPLGIELDVEAFE